MYLTCSMNSYTLNQVTGIMIASHTASYYLNKWPPQTKIIMLINTEIKTIKDT